MAKLTIMTDGVTPREIELQAGVNKIGRAFSNDFQIHAPSISGHHCEISLQDGNITVKDLGSTNGTFIDHQKITESPLLPGQTLRLGDVEMGHELPIAVQPAVRVAISRTAPVAVSEQAEEGALPVPPRMPSPPKRVTRLLPSSPAKKQKSFYKNIPGAFRYPFKRNGLILLASGTIFFGLLNFAYSFLGGFVSLIGIGIGIFITGYLFSFMQDIISSSAMGEEEMTSWPDYLNFYDSGLQPWLELAGTLVVTLGPGFACARFAPDEYEWCSITLLILGCLYLPMGLLAITMYGSLVALNPLTVIISIFRVPREYLVLCLLLGLLFCVSFSLKIVFARYVEIAIIPSIVEQFLSLYFLTVEMRLLGLLYYAKRDRLGWGF